MNTNEPQFLKAYNDLVTAFFNLMNVVSPQDSLQPNLSYIASQLNQLLNYLASQPLSVSQNTQQLQTSFPVEAPAHVSQAPVSQVQAPATSSSQHQPTFEATCAKTKYCAFPELVNGRYKFKSSTISEVVGEDSVYKLTIDDSTQTGYVEMQELSGDILKTVASNPSLYTPLDICPDAGSISANLKSVSSQSKLHLVKAIRGWEIVEGEIFKLIVES